MLAFLIVFLFSFIMFRELSKDRGKSDPSVSCKRQMVGAEPIQLVEWTLFMMGMEITATFIWGKEEFLSSNYGLQTFFSIFFTVAVYHLALLIVSGWIRKYFAASLLPALWLAPNILYLFFLSCFHLPTPQLVIPVDEKVALAGLILWFCGFQGILLTEISRHLRFRKQLILASHPVEDEQVIKVWEEELARFGKIKFPKNQLRICPDIRTPLTIGILDHFVMLPEKQYSEKELRWILRHELVHVYNQDCECKFFITFCKAMLWFLPVGWILGERVAEDLELSCDQMVVQGESPEDRKRYAALVLATGGESRGFTSCLSATGRSMRYRLGKIMNDGRRFAVKEAVLLSLAAIFLVAVCGRIQISTVYGSVYDLELADRTGGLQMADEDAIAFLRANDYLTDEYVYDQDLESFLNQMKDLQAYRISTQGDELFRKEYTVLCSCEDMTIMFSFSDHRLSVSVPTEDSPVYYYLPDNDWRSLF